MLPLLLISALAAEPSPVWVGTSVSGGGSPLRITVTSVPEDRRLVEVHWPAFDKTSMEQVLPTSTDCAHERLADGRERLDTVTRCLLERVPDRHPVYDYEDKTRVACVFGTKEGAPAAACKLQYCGWFDLELQKPR